MSTASVYQLDFKGRHGVAHGALNSALTTVSAAVVAHLVLQSGFATGLQVALSMLFTTVIGLMMIFLWGTVGRTANTGRVAYKATALIGSTVWSALVAMATWSAETVLQYGGALIMATVVMGFVAWMMRPAKEEVLQGEDELARLEQAARNDLGAEWELRLRKVLRLEAKVENIENFPHRTKDGRLIGYTVEAHLPGGGAGWRTVANAAQALANDLKLGLGCDVSVRMGTNRRIALIDVTIEDILAEEAMYDIEIKKRSVYDPIHIGLNRRNDPVGPILRERNVGMYGMGGSGKSNLGRVLTAGLMQCVDVLTCVIDLTGIRFAYPLINDYLNGKVSNPGVWWVAFNPDEAYLMLRALNRGALARNNHYNDLKIACNDDKMPCSEQYPYFMVMADETKHVTGINADRKVYSNFKLISDDHRDPGYRTAVMALRGTNEIVSQEHQAQQHVIVALPLKEVAEYRWVFGGSIGDICPEDSPYPGCAQVRLNHADPIKPAHIYRIEPEKLQEIAEKTADWRPEVDEITLLAMNGRDINGEPFDDLEPGELDCVDTRWDRLRAYRGERGVKDKKSGGELADTTSQNFKKIMEDLGRQKDALLQSADDAVNVDIDRRVEGFDIDAQLEEIFKDFPQPYKPHESSTEEICTFDRVYQIIVKAGEAGIKVSAILRILEEQGVEVDRTTVYRWVETMDRRTHKDRIEWRPDREGSRNGRWFAVDPDA